MEALYVNAGSPEPREGLPVYRKPRNSNLFFSPADSEFADPSTLFQSLESAGLKNRERLESRRLYTGNP